MRYYKIIADGYLVAIGNGSGGLEITAEEYDELREVIRNKPTAESGYDYRLTANLEWELYELPIAEETETTYTAEQLAEMTNDELKAICTELGISTYIDAENMITLIMDKQKGDTVRKRNAGR